MPEQPGGGARPAQESPGSASTRARWAGGLRSWGSAAWPWALVALAVLFALPSLAYPFGRDQGLYFYVAREWMGRGALPYQELFDQKPPGIHLLYAAASGLFGLNQWSIRLLELAAVVASGWSLARAAGLRRVTAREAAPAAALLVAFYYGCFDYWDTAQCEIWEGMLILLALVAATSRRPEPERGLLSGLCLGAAFLIKFPSLAATPVVWIVLCLPAWRARRRLRDLLQPTGWLALGLVALPLALAGYFALRGGLADAYDVLVGYNQFYLEHKHLASGELLAGAVWFWSGGAPLVAVLAAGLLWARAVAGAARRRDLPAAGPAAAAGALVAALGLSVLAQGKLYCYHWGVLAPLLALCAAVGLRVLSPRMRGAAALAVMAAILLAGSPRGGPRFPSVLGEAVAPDCPRSWYAGRISTFWRYLAGEIDRASYLDSFAFPGSYRFGYRYRDQEEVGRFVQSRAAAGDRLHVRGFEPALYQVAGLRSPSRFFVEFPLTDPALAYRREEWLAQHQAQLWSRPPRWFVTLEGMDDPRQLEAGGYRQVFRSGRFLLFERVGERRAGETGFLLDVGPQRTSAADRATDASCEAGG